LGAALAAVTPLACLADTNGPLTVHPQNPRYFADADGDVVYLTGSHTWFSLQDEFSPGYNIVFDYDEYLDFLDSHNHNFFRMWRNELPMVKYDASEPYRTISPHPWKRTGPGTAWDGEPKFDLTKFESDYFDRLRDRIIEAQQRGIYVAVVLFEGHALQQAYDGWSAHPFRSSNNINGINGDGDDDGYGTETHTLDDDGVLEIQEAYVKKVIDTINDLDNVIYEIANESHPGSVAWQQHLIDFINDYQADKPNQHPILFSTTLGGSNNMLFSSDAEAVAPKGSDYQSNPPPNNGNKVVISDSDHIFGCSGSVDWVWASFTRGLCPIYMDTYFDDYPYCLPPSDSVRLNMGYTLEYAQQINLATATPQGNLTNTGFCLAKTGARYLIFSPSGGNVTLNLNGEDGTYSVEWLNPFTGNTSEGSDITGGAVRTLNPPFGGKAIAFVEKISDGGGDDDGDDDDDNGGGGGGSGDDDDDDNGGGGGGGGSGGSGGSGGGGGGSGGSGGSGGGGGGSGGGGGGSGGGGGGSGGSGGGGSGGDDDEPGLVTAQQAVYVELLGAGDQLGRAMDNAGDVTNNGRNEIIVGAPRDKINGMDSAGRAYIFRYSPGGAGWLVYYTIQGEHAGDRTGWSVAGVGDIDDDGHADFAVGSPFCDESGQNAGRVDLYSGDGASLLHSFHGDEKDDLFGWAVAGKVDVNNDGTNDILISAPYHNDARGSVYVFSGEDFSLLKQINGEEAGDRFGFDLDGIGRANSDDHDDFVVGAPYNDAAGSNAGRVYVYSGKTLSVLYTIKGVHEGDRFGRAVSRLGRVNSDSRDDFAVGAPYYDFGGQKNAGWIGVYKGHNGGLIWNRTGSEANDGVGWSIAHVGDVDNDDRNDVLVSAYKRETNGVASGRIYVRSGENGSLLDSFYGEDDGDQFGFSLACAGDVDNDGSVELVIGARHHDDAGAESGRVYVVPSP
jgi:hypothetical protein